MSELSDTLRSWRQALENAEAKTKAAHSTAEAVREQQAKSEREAGGDGCVFIPDDG